MFSLLFKGWNGATEFSASSSSIKNNYYNHCYLNINLKTSE